MAQQATQQPDIKELSFEQALKEKPEIMAEMAEGRYGTLHRWLQSNIYQHGRMFTANELVQRISGEPLTIAPYMRYLWAKYGELFDL